MPRDMGRSREFIARRKQARAAAIWDPEQQADRSWMRFARCRGCGMKLCVNNYRDHKVRVSGLRRSGCLVEQVDLDPKVLVLCWRCARFAPFFMQLVEKVKVGSKKAQKLWDSYPRGAIPGELGMN